MKHEDWVNLLLLLVQNLNVFAWSPYEVPRVEGSFEAKDPRMIDYLKLVTQMMSKF